MSSLFERVSQDLVHGSKVVFLPAELKFFLFLVGRDFSLSKVYFALVIFFLVSDHYLDDGGFFPVVEFPFHFDVLVLPESQEFAYDFAIENMILAAFLGFYLSGSTGCLHDLPE